MEAATLTLLGFAPDIISWIKNSVQPKIELKPNKFEITKAEWKKEGYFTVCNKTDKPLFDTQILLWFSKDSITEPPMKVIEIEGQDNERYLDAKNIEINSGAFLIKGHANNKGVILIQLQYLAPKICKRVFFTLEQQIAGEIDLQAVSTSTNPSQTLSNAGKVAIPFIPPINIRVSSISLLMKKNT